MIGVVVAGAAGRMGQTVCAAVEQADDMELSGRAAAGRARNVKRAEITELPHDRKPVAPGGPGAGPAELMASAGAAQAPVIHSVRLPGLVAHQEVILGDLGQTLTIRHDTTSRESFMPGVLLAIRRVGELTESPIVGLEHLLF